MGHAFDNSEAKKLNIQIFETFYHAVLERPCELAEEFGTHEIYQGSPASKDEIQHHPRPHHPCLSSWAASTECSNPCASPKPLPHQSEVHPVVPGP
ncbi:hypothetical protein CF326_g7885 [Tilletia indica]|nr:hypothetical protein CF326_g7885 [Tilletia indica]